MSKKYPLHDAVKKSKLTECQNIIDNGAIRLIKKHSTLN